MPASYDDRSMAVYEMSHIPSVSFINPVSYRKCCEPIDSLVIELNENFLTELGTTKNPVKIGGDNAEDSSQIRLIFVGNSHASRLSACS
jgi:hypothetical protein